MENSTVAEFLLNFSVEGKSVEVPAALVAEVAHDTIELIRIYHSTYPLSGERKIRPPILPPAKYLSEPKIIEQYMKALKEGDLESLLECFEEDAYVREATGGSHQKAQRPFATASRKSSLMVAYRSSNARKPSTATAVSSNTIWNSGATKRSHPKPAAPSTKSAPLANSPRSESMMILCRRL